MATVQNPSKTLHRYAENYSLDLTLRNGEATESIQQGQLVYLSGDNSVSRVTTGAQYPIGIMKTGAIATEIGAVRTNLLCDVQAVAMATMAAGAFVRPNGNLNADGLPEVVATTAGDNTQMIVIAGGAIGTVIRVGVLRTPRTV